MNGHIGTWINPYLDGELSPANVLEVEEHLASCPDCASLVARQRSLSQLLQDAPPAELRKTEAQFSAEVERQLVRRPTSPAPARRPLNLAWGLIPVGLLAAFAFVQAVLILSSVLGWIPGAAQTLSSRFSILSSWAVLLQPVSGLLPFADQVALQPAWLSVLQSITGPLPVESWVQSDWLTGPLVLVGFSLIYLFWLVGWYLRAQPEMKKIIQ